MRRIGGEQIDWRVIDDQGWAWSSGQRRLIISYILPYYGIKLILIRNLEHNVGKTRNLNWAVFSLVGDIPFVLVVDGDTVVEPWYAEKLLSVMLRDKRVAAAYGWPIPITSCGNLLCKVLCLMRF